MQNSNALRINEEQENFLSLFVLVSPIRKQIWNCICALAKKYWQCFPSHQKIAQLVGCCRDTVIQAMKYFKEMGWIAFLKRSYRSNLYFIPKDLLKLDTRNFKVYERKNYENHDESRERPTEKPTLYVYSILNKCISNSIAMETFEKKVFEKRERVQTFIPLFLRIQGISIPDQQILANSYSEYVLRQALDRTKWHVKQFGMPEKLIALLTYYCKKIENEQKG